MKTEVGGGNFLTAAQWCSGTTADPLDLGYDLAAGVPATLPQNSLMFQSIRWDGGGPADGAYDLEIPIPSGDYLVSMFFCEACCPNRHQTTTIEGVVVEPDVHANQYAAGTQQAGRLSYSVTVDDESLDINLVGCLDPDCPGGGDANPILSALEVVPSDYVVCDEPGVGQCPTDFTCSVDNEGGSVALSWSNPPCGLTLDGYQIWRNGEEIATLDVSENSFEDEPTGRLNTYELLALSEGEGGCPPLSCSVVVDSVPFAVPLRINMGGPATTDELGRAWLGDPGAGQDVLGIRPVDNGGFNTIEAWCAPAPTPVDLGYDNGAGIPATLPANSLQFRSIRWDGGGPDDGAYDLAIPIPNGDYVVSMFFCEACCLNRHQTTTIEGEVVDQDVHANQYAAGAQQVGRLAYDVTVEDEVLDINLVGCLDPDCPGGGDANPILNALEVVTTDFTVCDDPGVGQCPSGLTCSFDADTGAVTGTWTEPLCVASLSGYELLRNGESIGDLPGDATEFTDEPTERINVYELVPTVEGDGEGEASCATLSCEAVVPTAPFGLPLRINMGGDATVDSHGDLWLGDRPCGLPENADPLDIRPDDNGGGQSICDWCPPLPDSIDNMGFDGTHPGDRHIFSTIRWDEAAPPIYTLEIPLPGGGEHDITMYFNECCCAARHFQIELQGRIVNEDVNFEDYNPMSPALTAAGRLRFSGVEVCSDGLLTIRLLPCPEPDCPGSTDQNAILNALSIERSGGGTPNNPPNARIQVEPSTTVVLSDGEATVHLDGATSDDGDNGTQELTYRWSQIDPPNEGFGANSFATPTEVATEVTILQGAGTYRFELEVDDGQGCANLATTEVDVTVIEGVLFVRGDVDSSGLIELTDGVVALSYLFSGGTEPACFDSADVDDSGTVELTDAVLIFGWLFLGGPAPSPPSPTVGEYAAEDCGIDPTDDDLDCASAGAVCS